MLLSSLALAAVPLLASVARAAPAAGVVLKREALVQSIEADLRARGWTDDRVNELEVEALEADILALAAEKRLFGWGEDDSSDEGYAPVKTTCEPNTVFVRAADSYVLRAGGLSSRLAKLDRELISPLPDSYSLPRSLNEAEKAHIQTRLNPNRFLTYLASIGVEPSALNLNLNSSSSTNSTPNVGAAWSGGGYRAMVNGGGNLSVAQRLLCEREGVADSRLPGILVSQLRPRLAQLGGCRRRHGRDWPAPVVRHRPLGRKLDGGLDDVVVGKRQRLHARGVAEAVEPVEQPRYSGRQPRRPGKVLWRPRRRSWQEEG
jgi:hypothetical protein